MTTEDDNSKDVKTEYSGGDAGSGRRGAKDKENKSGGKSKREKVKPLTKIIIRRLPPTMTEETFLKQIDPIPDNDHFYYVPADWSLGLNASCRAYINFTNHDDIFIFKDKFDGYVFVDTKGTEYPAVVEFAPFQGLPRNRSRKKDNKSSSIEIDPHYLAFVENLTAEQNETGKSESKLEFSYQFKDDKKITKTPLLDFLANRKQENRDERKRRTDEKKKRRDDDRQRKKATVSKSIPPAIQEEESKILVDEDDIMVRTIKSRPLDRDRNRNTAKKERVFENKQNREKTEDKSDNRKPFKDRQERRQAERRKERDQRRNEERANRKEEKKEEVTVKQSAEKTEEKPHVQEKPIDPPPPVKREVKKYSEVRRERRARASGKAQENASSNTRTEEHPAPTDTKTKKSDADQSAPLPTHAKSKRRETAEERAKRESDERHARRIKNKDRPSIEIYRPGKLRTGTKGEENSDGERDSRRASLKGDEVTSLTKEENSASGSSPSGEEKREMKLYEMSADIPPFIPKSHKPKSDAEDSKQEDIKIE